MKDKLDLTPKEALVLSELEGLYESCDRLTREIEELRRSTAQLSAENESLRRELNKIRETEQFNREMLQTWRQRLEDVLSGL